MTFIKRCTRAGTSKSLMMEKALWNWGWFHILIMTNSQPFFCACGLVGVEEEGEGRGQELIVTHFHASEFQESIPIMISHFESMHVHLNHTAFILSYALGFLTSKNV